MEPVEALRVGLADYPCDLRVQAVVRRWPIFDVHLEVFRDRGHPFAESLKKCRIRRFGRYDRARQEDHGIAGLGRTHRARSARSRCTAPDTPLSSTGPMSPNAIPASCE